MKITVTITEDDITDGACGDAMFCPVAKALRRQGYDGVFVSPYDADFGPHQDVKLPPVARAFVSEFDAQMQVRPITFELDTELTNVP